MAVRWFDPTQFTRNEIKGSQRARGLFFSDSLSKSRHQTRRKEKHPTAIDGLESCPVDCVPIDPRCLPNVNSATSELHNWRLQTMRVRQKQKPTVAGLFAGCGGFDLGFEQAGYESVVALDIDPVAVATYNANLSGNAAICDLSSLSRLSLPRRPDVIIAGPPCQGFSTLGRRAENDPRNSLLITAANLALQAKPKVIVLENVSGVVAGSHRHYWNSAREMLQRAGFHTREFRVIGTEFGLPQIRKRVILLAAQCSLDSIDRSATQGQITLDPFLAAVDGLPNHSPRLLNRGTAEYRIAQRIRPHQKLCNVRGGQRSVPTWDIPEVFGAVTAQERQLLCIIQKVRRQRRLRSFGDADPLTLNDLQESCEFNAARPVKSLHAKGYLRQIGRRFDLAHTFNGKFRRLSREHPAPTVDTRFGQPRYFLHPDEHRGMSAREAARIQGFPDDFTFYGSLSAQFRLIGNAVPPPIGLWFAEMIRDRLL